MLFIYTFLLLLLGHLLADFVFQPKELVQWKFRSNWGIFIHSAVHLVLYFIILWQLSLNIGVALILATVALTHFIVDRIKIYFESKKNPTSYVKLFLLDQLAHFVVIVAASFVITKWLQSLFSKSLTIFDFLFRFNFIIGGIVLLLLPILIISTYVVEIYKFQLKRQKNPKTEFKPDKKAMIKRALISILLFIVLSPFWVPFLMFITGIFGLLTGEINNLGPLPMKLG